MPYDEDLAERVRELLARPHVREMDFTGRRLKGLVYVGARGVRTSRQLESWIERGLRFVRSLPAKHTHRS